MNPLEQVKAAIPHREPFLFVDEILERAKGRIVTQRLVRADEPHFAGHYPGAPLMPGVLLCEACFQTGAMLLGNTGGAGVTPVPPGRKPVLTRILEAKFRGMVRPGDLMRIEVQQEEKMGDAYVMNGRVDVAGKNVLRVKFIVAMVEVGA
ncbi:MAG: beta-hydroxyacyl-ACP dehydratase [Planctomycetes bacterium]|jgi:3-hydroxyacyl-[acyl-carrier-protein] dehydratase|nr:beta-hydroxyacyl-ACP dehydratase [Planctomycetota bacterium]MCL4731463.1 beta-hydroxyacyl-ACP dehydratase [Planctomycetota bacterium]